MRAAWWWRGGGGGCVGGVDRLDEVDNDDAANSGRAGYMIRFAMFAQSPSRLYIRRWKSCLFVVEGSRPGVG